MTRLALLPALLLAGCGSDAALLRYTIDVTVEAPDWLDQDNAPSIDIPPCTNAELFDATLRVYDDFDDEAVAAYRFLYTGFDLTNGGDNEVTYLVTPDLAKRIYATLLPNLEIYELNHKGQLVQVDRDAANIKGKSETTIEYEIGGGVPIVETHVLRKEVDEVDFVEPGAWQCDQLYAY